MNRILLVEDEPDTSSFIRYVLEEEGWDVTAANSVGSALEKLGQGPVDLILLDRGLPDGDGLELCRELRRKEDWSTLPVLFMTARKSVADIAEGLDAGGDDYLVKPFSFVELLARVKSLLRRAQKYAEFEPLPRPAPADS